jgi:dienelactone hydrolase
MVPRILLVVLLSASVGLCADPPIPGRANPRMPPVGIAVPPETKADLEKGVSNLGRAIENLEIVLKSKPELLELLPDIQIYYNAVRYALEDDIFYKEADFAAAQKLIEEGMDRARLLKEGQAPWNTESGLVARGYVSKIDGSVQPYGLVVPVSYQPGTAHKLRLDFWFHGRNNNGSEVSFIVDREKNGGEFTPQDTIVLHPYGRYCNAFKFTGETDAFEALDSVRKHYPIDENRISVRGFSMGGAAAWHFAGHYAGMWDVASPGAGFVDTAIFQKLARQNIVSPWYEQRLWHLYDVTDYAANLFNCPVVAYSGEIDPQKQAADLMSRAMAAEGLDLTHIIGPKTAHKFEPKAKEEVARRVEVFKAQGRNSVPKRVRFTTWTLRYNQMDWVTVDGLERHWSRARVNADIIGNGITVTTTNVSMLTLSMPAGLCPLAQKPIVTLDGQQLAAPEVAADGSWTAHFEKLALRWQIGSPSDGRLRKQHGLQGPIDDAFLDSFIMVRPTGKPLNNDEGAWTQSAMKQAIEDWRMQFRGEPRVKDDSAVTDEEMAASNLVLWGDPHSNRLFGRIAKRLPILWDTQGVHIGGKIYSLRDHVPVMIYPNPLNPKHYVVINSCFTFSEAAPTSNALQIPKLPDYAVFDLKSKCVVEAGFFDEEWKLPILQ